MPGPARPTFIVSSKSVSIIYTDFGAKFRELVTRPGLGGDSLARPRTHDLRHWANSPVKYRAGLFRPVWDLPPVLLSAQSDGTRALLCAIEMTCPMAGSDERPV